MGKLVEDKTMKIQNLSAVEIQRIEPLDMLGLVRAVWYGKLTIAISIALAVLAAGYYAFAVAQPKYAATTTLKIETGANPMAEVEHLATGFSPDQTSLNTEAAVLRSRHLLEQVVTRLDLTADPAFNRYLVPRAPLSLMAMRERLRVMLSGNAIAPPDAAGIIDKTIDNLANALHVGTLRDTHIFQITVTTGNARQAAQIADMLANVYLSDQISAKQAATEAAVNWLSARVYDLQLELEAKETEVNDLIARNRANDTAILDALSRQSVEADERLQAARQALISAQLKMQGLDATPAGLGSTARPNRARLQAEIERYGEQTAALEIFQSSINTQLADHSANLVALQQLRREADATRVLYETFLARLQETSIQRGLQNADSRILTQAAPGRYVGPRKVLILLIAAVLGGLAGTAIVLIRNGMKNGFTDPDALGNALNLPVFAQIPRINMRKPTELLDYLQAKPTSALAELIRHLRTSLLLADPSRVPQVILSTSSVPGEGKTTQSIALAHHLSNLGKSVLLIEADMRQPTFQTYLHCRGSDLAAIVTDDLPLAPHIRKDPRLRADVLPSGGMTTNPADLFSDQAFASFMQKVRAEYDFVVIDAPPVLPVPDARLLAQHCDSVLYAVRWDSTDSRLVQAGKAALETVHVPIAGLVLGRVDARKVHRYGDASLADYGRAYYQN
ncbi:GumC family protein [Yoonia sp. SS1-5]|uniref:non-specific protein-tyrosine kinase n=1 Tax=Yoonia rhodophyticola TaxID=3137370 RepID=A0AAN0M8X0_9RHOB